MKKVFWNCLFLVSTLTAQSALAVNLDRNTSEKLQKILNLQEAGSGTLTMISVITEKVTPSLYYRLGFDHDGDRLLINNAESQPTLQDLFETLSQAGVKIGFVNEGTSYHWLQVNLVCTSADSCSVENVKQ